jgi:transposase
VKAVRESLPQAAHVFDRFHVIKLMNEKLTELRRDVYREAVDQMHRHVLKGTRWLLLMGGGRNAGLAGPPGDTQAGPGQ